MSDPLLKVMTAFVNPPIPIRTSDWIAWFDAYGEDGPREYGRTEAQAVERLWAGQGMTVDQKCIRCGHPADVVAGCAMGGCPIGNDI